jgi:hypothetical protein
MIIPRGVADVMTAPRDIPVDSGSARINHDRQALENEYDGKQLPLTRIPLSAYRAPANPWRVCDEDHEDFHDGFHSFLPAHPVPNCCHQTVKDPIPCGFTNSAQRGVRGPAGTSG